MNLQDHFGLVRTIADRFAKWGECAGLDRDDLMQEGFIALLAAATKFDAGRGLAFSTLAMTCIRNRVANAILTFSRRGKQARGTSDVLDLIPAVDRTSPFDEALKNEAWSMLESLRPKDAEILRLQCRGVKLNDIRDRLGISRTRINELSLRGRRTLRGLVGAS